VSDSTFNDTAVSPISRFIVLWRWLLQLDGPRLVFFLGSHFDGLLVALIMLLARGQICAYQVRLMGATFPRLGVRRHDIPCCGECCLGQRRIGIE